MCHASSPHRVVRVTLQYPGTSFLAAASARRAAPGLCSPPEMGLLEQIEKMSPMKMNMNCIALRRPVQTAAEEEVNRAKTKAFRDAVTKISDSIVNSLVVVTVVSPSKSAAESPSRAAAAPEYDVGEAIMCYECEPSPPASPTLSRTTSWSSA